MTERERTVALELLAYVGLAWFAAAHWADGLVSDAPSGSVVACVFVGVAAGLALAVTVGIQSQPARIALRIVCALAALAAGFVAMGLDSSYLAPRHWDELIDGIDRGFAGLGSAEWPYAGPEAWTRLVLLLAIPLALSLSAALSFWPGRQRFRPAGLALLVALYATAVTEHQFSAELARGVALLLLVAAWLWLPRMPQQGGRTAAIAAGAVAVACLAALPAAARYDERKPWIDYEKWNPFEERSTQRFDWSHSYGPMDWPRDATTIMNVRSNQRHYWRVETLDRFDGFRWVPAGIGRGNNPMLPQPYRPRWESDFKVTIRNFATDLFPVAGTAIEVSGADPVVVPNEDGTVSAIVEALEPGDSYEVKAYVPDPSPAQMRRAPSPYPSELYLNTLLFLPPPGTTALEGTGRAGDAARSDFDITDVPVTLDQIARSPYRRVLRLARRLARDKPTNYDKVLAIQRYLRANFTYSERPPSQEFPLAAFLFEDRIGYCQQFSGAMALMLRMLGIPTRVAAGFTPGSYNRETKEYRVRDLDAHSWVEVWFTGVGWVPFDPTPAIAPAESQSSADAASASGGAPGTPEATDRRGGQSTFSLSERAGGGVLPSLESSDEGGTAGWLLAAGLALLAAAVLGVANLAARIRRRERPAAHERDVAELRRALARVGEPAPATLTLRRLEERLEASAGPPAARYVQMLRQRRYAREGGSMPGRAERSALRRALASGRGPLGRLRALAALPPLAFRRG